MVWNQYVQDANNVPNDDNISDEDERIVPRNRAMRYDDWSIWYSRDLLNMWMGMKAYSQDAGVSNYIMNDCSFTDFCEFCYEFSSKFPSRFPS
jgi:hypothetical protein